MSLIFVEGDPLQTHAQALLLAMNLRGQVAVHPLETAMRDRYPVFYSEHRRLARQDFWQGGQLWFFRDATPLLVGAMVQDSANGVVKLRFLEQALISLRREYQEQGITSLAVAPMGDALEWSSLRALLVEHVTMLPIPIVIYQQYLPQTTAEESNLP